jgi:hypothetical protein
MKSKIGKAHFFYLLWWIQIHLNRYVIMYNKQNYMISKWLSLAKRSIEQKQKLSEQLLEKKEKLRNESQNESENESGGDDESPQTLNY